MTEPDRHRRLPEAWPGVLARLPAPARLVLTGLLLGGACLGLVVAFVLSPLPVADDWQMFYDVAGHVLRGQPLYNTSLQYTVYPYPPWVAVGLAPLSWLPMRWGWAVLVVISLALALAVARRWCAGYIKPVLFLISPPMLYVLLHGQMDALVLAGCLLPREWWVLVALTKPQITGGLALGVLRARWRQMLLVTALGLLISFIWFGDWPLQLWRQPAAFIQAPHNVMGGVWPLAIPVGVFLLVMGLRRKEDRLLLAASPFFAPYVATSSLLGLWLAVLTFLTDVEAGLVWLSWWGVIVYRALRG